MIGPMTREQLIRETRRLAEEGDRLQTAPSMGGLRLWLQLSDDLLSTAWGSMSAARPVQPSLARPMARMPEPVPRSR